MFWYMLTPTPGYPTGLGPFYTDQTSAESLFRSYAANWKGSPYPVNLLMWQGSQWLTALHA